MTGICYKCGKEFELTYIDIKYTIENQPTLRKLYCSNACKEKCLAFQELMGGDFSYKGLIE